MSNQKFNSQTENMHEGNVYLKNAYDSEAYQLFQKPYNACSPAEKEQAKSICKNPPRSVGVVGQNVPDQKTGSPTMQKTSPTNLTTEAQKETYLIQKEVERAEFENRMKEAHKRGDVKKQISQLEIDIRKMPVGLERAEALKKLYELKTGKTLSPKND